MHKNHFVNAEIVVVSKAIYSGSDTDKSGAEGLTFCYPKR